MKKKILIVFIYLLGCCLSYVSLKKNMIYDHRNMDFPAYSVMDRTVAIGMSLFSWVGLVASGIIYIITHTDGNAPAKW